MRHRGVIVKPTAADASWIRTALEQARIAAAQGEIPIGAVVIGPSGHLLAAAANQREERCDPTAHAEILALRGAAAELGSWRLDGCVLAVTLEPCPMCAGAIAQARIARCVFGAWNPDYGAAGSQWDLLRDRRLAHRVEVVAGVLAADCQDLLDHFFAAQRGSGQ